MAPSAPVDMTAGSLIRWSTLGSSHGDWLRYRTAPDFSSTFIAPVPSFDCARHTADSKMKLTVVLINRILDVRSICKSMIFPAGFNAKILPVGECCAL
jgi:hypothetical protein